MSASPYLNWAASASEDPDPGAAVFGLVDEPSQAAVFGTSADQTWATGSFDDDLAVPAPSASAGTPGAPAAAVSPAGSAWGPDLSEPEWARIKPSDWQPPTMRGMGGDLGPPAADTSAGEAASPAATQRPAVRQRQRRTSPSPAAKRSADMRGGRWKVKALRGAVYLVLGLLLLGGVRNLGPSRTPTVEALTEKVAASLGESGFPTAAGEAFAVRFATVYLTYDENTREQRAAALAGYAHDVDSGAWGWDGQGRQRIINGPLVASRPTLNGTQYATVTVAAQIDTGAWVHLAVPIFAADATTLAVAAAPAFMPAPTRADLPAGNTLAVAQTDDGLGQALASDVLTGYLTAWAASDPVALARYTTPEASVAARIGLGGTVRLGQIRSVKVPREDADRRNAVVDVAWAAGPAGSYVQTYQIEVVQQADGRWYVADLSVGTPPAGN